MFWPIGGLVRFASSPALWRIIWPRREFVGFLTRLGTLAYRRITAVCATESTSNHPKCTVAYIYTQSPRVDRFPPWSLNIGRNHEISLLRKLTPCHLLDILQLRDDGSIPLRLLLPTTFPGRSRDSQLSRSGPRNSCAGKHSPGYVVFAVCDPVVSSQVAIWPLR